MSFKLGIVGLCTSHPQNWVPIIRAMTEEKLVDIDIISVWDSAETRPKGFAKEFAEEYNIPKPVDRLTDMVEMVDGVIIHTANWDKHIEQAKPFVEADKSVFLDKPIVGNMQDVNQLLDWSKQGKRILGGSGLRFVNETSTFLADIKNSNAKILYAFAGCGTDEFNYGIHGYSMLSGLMGPGIRSVSFLGFSGQNLLKISWNDGKVGFLATGAIGKGGWLGFYMTVVTEGKGIFHTVIDTKKIYRSMLEVTLPYLTGKDEKFIMPLDDLLEPELAAMAARISRMNNGAEISLKDLRVDDAGYDGAQFAIEYRRTRMV